MNRSKILMFACAALALSACVSEPALADNHAKGVTAPVELVASAFAPYEQPASFDAAAAADSVLLASFAADKLPAFKFVDVETAFAVDERMCPASALTDNPDYMTALGSEKPDKTGSRDEVRGLVRKSKTEFIT